MARIQKSNLTKLQIIKVATKMFLEKGYSSTSAKMICSELGISTGNLTFYFPGKEDLLAEMTDMLCRFQWNMMQDEVNEGFTPPMAICLELMAMAAICDEDSIAKDFYIAAYTSPLCLDIIRKNDIERAKKIFGEYRRYWTHEHFSEAELIVSGIEYSTLMTAGSQVSLKMRISGAIQSILLIYGIPEDNAKIILERCLEMNYIELGRNFMTEFKKFVERSNEQALLDLLRI